MTPPAHGVAPLAVQPAGGAEAGYHAELPLVLSRDAVGVPGPMRVSGENLNAWSRIPGAPLSGDFILVPNEPDGGVLSVTFGPFEVPSQIDTFTFVCASHAEPRSRNMLRLEASVADEAGVELGRAGAAIPSGEERAVTVRFPGGRPQVCLTVSALFDDLVVPQKHERLYIRYALGYRSNELVELFNQTGTDKGTAVWAGGGVPHCYALEYDRLFRPFRHEAFNMLEIGLDIATPPTDVPSLRAWRAYFPNAVLYGYDIEDFAFVHEHDVFVFQGNQASRTDVSRFLETYGSPLFRVVLDDGSHAASHQQISLAALFRQVEPGGLYVVEDMSWQPFPESPTTAQVLRQFAETRRFESPYVTEEEARYLESAIDSVEILKPNDSEIGVLQKREAS
jgi:hypothetical protein